MFETMDSKQWYYTDRGNQMGPVSFEELKDQVQALSDSGDMLVWSEGMPDWVAPERIPGLDMPIVNPDSATNPYAPPQVSNANQNASEIQPQGNYPLDFGQCIRTAWECTNSNLGKLFLFGLIYMVIIIAWELLNAAIGTLFGIPFMDEGVTQEQLIVSAIGDIIGEIISIFLGLGGTIFGLNLLKGKEANVGQIFTGGRFLLRQIGASIIYAIIVILGIILLVIPGIYLAIRLGQFQNALVEKDLGPIEALKASWQITEGNVINYLALFIISIGIVLLGMLALLVGLIWAYPTAILANISAYLYMSRGKTCVTEE